ncbi:MAG: tryptophan synthase subunit beta, partial [Rickettsiales bacterium]|nr:tryptophan synthase subunit beta [Rickettsiales bacterium]
HSWLKDKGRVKYVYVNDKQALNALKLCSRLEGIIPALEPAHALHFVLKYASQKKRDHIIVMNMCGRGDKDLDTIMNSLK